MAETNFENRIFFYLFFASQMGLITNILTLNHHSTDSALLSSKTGDILHLVPPNALNYWEIKVEDWETLKLKNLEHANSNAWLINETHARKCVSFGTRKWVPTRTSGRQKNFFGGRGVELSTMAKIEIIYPKNVGA